MIDSDNKINLNHICSKYDCKIDHMGNIYNIEDEKLNRIGKIYTTKHTNYFHSKTLKGSKCEGQKTFESALITLLRHLNLL